MPLALFTSCDKDEVKPFDLTLTLSGVTQVDGNFYNVAGENVTIDNLEVTSLGTKTAVSNVMFFVDGIPLLPSPWNMESPWNFSTENFDPGRHTLSVSGYLLQVDQSLKEFAVSYPLTVVESQEDLPEGAPETGTYSATVHFTGDK